MEKKEKQKPTRNSKKSIIVGIAVLFVVMLILLGLTYAYYRTRVIGNQNNESISVTSKKLGISYEDGSAILSTDGLIEPGFTATKEFRVINTGDETATFSIILDKVNNTFTRTSDWTYELTGTGLTEPVTGEVPISDTIIVYTISIASQETKNYSLKVTYANLEDENQSDDMGKSLTFRVNIADAQEAEAPAQTWETAREGTLLYAIKDHNTVTEPKTIPGQAVSAADEAVLVATEDDYGTSYYFRGAVENNYVNYSGMCWRIVRVDGNSNIKLVLEDQNGECNRTDYLNSTKISTIQYKNDYFGVWDKNYMTNFNDGTIIDDMTAWATTGNENIDGHNLDFNVLATVEWCSDNSIAYVEFSDGYEDVGIDSPHAEFALAQRGPYKRLVDKTTANPTLTCNQVGLYNSSATKIVGTLGILSADEIAFAGGAFGIASTSTYLSSSGNIEYWTLSPANLGDVDLEGVDVANPFIISSPDGNAFYFHSSGGLGSDSTYSDYIRTRPSIALKNNVTLSTSTSSTQVGTQTNPYVID